MMRTSRRNFFRTIGAGLAGLGLLPSSNLLAKTATPVKSPKKTTRSSLLEMILP